MTGIRAAAVACVVAITLAGCTDSARDRDRDCRPSGTAVVTAVADDGRSWTASTAATADPPTIGGGYVLVRHSCGWTAFDLEDGTMTREGGGEAAGVAGGFVFTLDGDGDSVTGEPVVEGAAPDGYGSMVVSSPGADLQALAVDDHLYVFRGSDGPVGLTQYAGPDARRWDAQLPVLRSPTLTAVGATLVATSTEGSVYGIDTSDGDVLWRVLAPASGSTQLLRVRSRGEDEVVVTAWEAADADAPGTVVVLDAATGEQLDRTAAPDPRVPALAAAADGWRVRVESEPIPYVMEE